MRGVVRWARRALVLACAGVVVACGGGGKPEVKFSDDRFLAVWAGDADRKDSDFLAIIDADPKSDRYGNVLRTIPVRSAGNEPAGLNDELRRDRRLFATGLLSNRTFVFDLRDPLKGGLVAVDEPRNDHRLAAPRGVATLPGGRAVVACADVAGYRGDAREVLGAPGGLRVVTADGGFVGEVIGAGGMARGFVVAPSGVALRSNLNVAVSTDQAHGFAPTTAGAPMPGITVQVWSLPDLRLKQTVVLEAGPRGEENLGPRTVRLLRERPFALVATHDGGALYVSDSVHTATPAFRLVHDFGAGSRPAGAAVTPDDRWYVVALPGSNQVVALDVRDPWDPEQRSSLRFDRDPDPTGTGAARDGHPGAVAMSLDGMRIAVADYTVDTPAYTLDGDRRVYMLRLDRDTGRLRFDDAFRDEVTHEVGVRFDRDTWPHGRTGPARPAAALFISPAPPPDER